MPKKSDKQVLEEFRRGKGNRITELIERDEKKAERQRLRAIEKAKQDANSTIAKPVLLKVIAILFEIRSYFTAEIKNRQMVVKIRQDMEGFLNILADTFDKENKFQCFKAIFYYLAPSYELKEQLGIEENKYDALKVLEKNFSQNDINIIKYIKEIFYGPEKIRGPVIDYLNQSIIKEAILPSDRFKIRHHFNDRILSLLDQYKLMEEILFSKKDFKPFPYELQNTSYNYLSIRHYEKNGEGGKSNYFGRNRQGQELKFFKACGSSAHPQNIFAINNDDYRKTLRYEGYDHVENERLQKLAQGKNNAFMNIKLIRDDAERLAVVLDCLQSIFFRKILGTRVSLTVPIFNLENAQLIGCGSVYLPNFHDMDDLSSNNTIISGYGIGDDLPKEIIDKIPWKNNPEYELMGLVSVTLLCFLLRENDMHKKNYGSTTRPYLCETYEVIGKIDHDYIQWANLELINSLKKNSGMGLIKKYRIDKSAEKNKKEFEIAFNLLRSNRKDNPLSPNFCKNYTKHMRFSPFNRNSLAKEVGHDLRSGGHKVLNFLKYLSPLSVLAGQPPINSNDINKDPKPSTYTDTRLLKYVEKQCKENHGLNILEIALTVKKLREFIKQDNWNKFRDEVNNHFVQPLREKLGKNSSLGIAIQTLYEDNMTVFYRNIERFTTHTALKKETSNKAPSFHHINELLEYFEKIENYDPNSISNAEEENKKRIQSAKEGIIMNKVRQKREKELEEERRKYKKRIS